MRIVIRKNESEENMTFEVEGFSAEISNSTIETEKTAEFQVSGEGTIVVEAPARIIANCVKIQGGPAKIQMKSSDSIVKEIISPKFKPKRGITKEVLDLLERGDMTLEEITNELQLTKKQVYNVLYNLKKNNLISVVNGKYHRNFVERKNPSEIRYPGVMS